MNVPAILLVLAPIPILFALLSYLVNGPLANRPLSLGLLAGGFAIFIVLPMICAWLWWSLTAPKWRIWALRRHGDWPTLERRAIAAQLIWDEKTRMGRLISRTEIWSEADRKTFAALRYYSPGES